MIQKILSGKETPIRYKLLYVGLAFIGTFFASYLLTPNSGYKKQTKNIVTTIKDQNYDGFPEFEVTNPNNSIDTLISHIENDKIIYRPKIN